MALDIYLFTASQTRTDILDGSSRIMIECARRWLVEGHHFHIITCKEGRDLYQRYGLRTPDYIVVRSARPTIGIYILYLLRTLKLSNMAFKFRVKDSHPIIMSASDFLPDFIPAWILKMRSRRAKWIVTFYLLAPKPLSSDSPYKGRAIFKGLVYFISQMLTLHLARKYADMVWVTNGLDKYRFLDNKRLDLSRIVTVQWGVNTESSSLVPEPENKMFDAVFVGRLHPQKGVLELIDIWRYVLAKKPDAKLAIIGSGDLERTLRQKIDLLQLQDKIVLFGFRDGEQKLEILKASRIFVHPATYDTGAIAPMEAMACGLPGISFDLPALRSYYPRGMIRVKPGEKEAFGETVLQLLNDQELFGRLKEEASQLARESDWAQRSHQLLEIVKSVSM